VAQSVLLLSFWLDKPEFGARQEKEFSRQCPVGPVAHPKSYSVGTGGSFLGEAGRA
jgi:hypothetical protein